MITNRQIWLDAIFDVEGGWSNHPEDSGRETMMGITLATFRAWRGDEDATAEDLRAISKQECGEIYLARYWNAVRADQLPGGIDIYTADFAVSSGPGRAAAKLQELIGAKVDTFIAEKSIAAVRAKEPMQLLLDYHQARMEFLMSLKNWTTFGRGWTNRCSKMLALSRTLVEKRPTLSEMASSTIVKGAAAGAAVTGTAIATTPAFDWQRLWDMFQRLLQNIPGMASGLPEALQSAEPSVRATIEQAQQAQSITGAGGDIALVAGFFTYLFIIYRRFRMYAKGLS